MYMSKMKIMYDEITQPKTQQYKSSCYFTSLQPLPIQCLSLQGGKTQTEQITF